MIIVLSVVLAIILGIVCWIVGHRLVKKDAKENPAKYYSRIYKGENLLGFGVVTVIVGIISLFTFILFPLSISYNSYLHCRAFYDSIYSQYRGNITLYKDHITIIPPAVTDFTGQTYAKEMSDKINSLQNSIVEYNNLIIKKRIMKKNVIFSWLIVAPDDDMKTMNIIN